VSESEFLPPQKPHISRYLTVWCKPISNPDTRRPWNSYLQNVQSKYWDRTSGIPPPPPHLSSRFIHFLQGQWARCGGRPCHLCWTHCSPQRTRQIKWENFLPFWSILKSLKENCLISYFLYLSRFLMQYSPVCQQYVRRNKMDIRSECVEL